MMECMVVQGIRVDTIPIRAKLQGRHSTLFLVAIMNADKYQDIFGTELETPPEDPGLSEHMRGMCERSTFARRFAF